MIREFLQQLPFGHRLPLYRLLIALFLGGMIYYAFFFPKEGDRAMRRGAEAMSRAKSWKSETIRELPDIGGRMEILEEVSCPGSSRITWHQTQQIAGSPPEWTMVTVAIGDSGYRYHSVSDKWVRDAPTGGPQSIWQALARGEDTPSLPSLSEWSKHALISKGDRRETGAGSCQEWKIATRHGNAVWDEARVCLDENDHLPRFVAQNGAVTRYFDWNAPIDIQAPELVQQSSP